MNLSKKVFFGLVFCALIGIVLWRRSYPTSGSNPTSSAPSEREIQRYAPEDLNPFILEVMNSFPEGSIKMTDSSQQSKTYGVTEDIYYKGRRVMSANKDRSAYCSGLIIETYMKSCKSFSLSHGKEGKFELNSIPSSAEFIKFRREFYGVTGNRRTFVDALATRKLGLEIAHQDAQPGDLVQFWRKNGTGHSGVFLKWDKDSEGRVDGLIYWSVQKATGVAVNRESVDDPSKASIDSKQIYVVRAKTPELY